MRALFGLLCWLGFHKGKFIHRGFMPGDFTYGGKQEVLVEVCARCGKELTA